MFRSIRWRLVASYTLLTLLTVSLLGLLVLSLMQRYVASEEEAFLNANAEAVARQSALFMQPAIKAPALSQLAQTSAFLSDVHVKILDVQKRLVADSGQPAAFDQLTWVVGPAPIPPVVDGQGPAFVFSTSAVPNPLNSVEQSVYEASNMGHVRSTEPSQLASAEPLPPELGQSITVRKLPSMWGVRLDFDAGPVMTRTVASNVTFIDKRQLALSTPLTVEFAGASNTVMAPIRTGDEVLGYVELSRRPNFAAETLATMRNVFLMAAVSVALIAVGLGLVVSRGLTAPLQGLTTATSRMNSGDLSARAPVHSDDEIGGLARQFNQMATALENSFAALAAERDALRRFIADASHELRTPITALRTFNELLQGAAANDPVAQQEFLREGQEQINRLERITSGLLNLSRLDSGLFTLTLAEHELGEMVAAVATPFKTLAQERNIRLSVEAAPEPVLARCDRSQLEMALSNLLDNALKFTPPGGQIQIGLAKTDQWGQIWVKDSGPGIAVVDLPYIFERFYRGRNATSTGSGLGLAIVQSILHAHHGRVQVSSEVGQGSCFTLLLPG